MRRDESCLYTLMHAPRESHERLLAELVAPIVREIRDARELDCIFFARYSEPDWQLRFRVLGRPGWIEAAVKPRIDRALERLHPEGLIREVEFASYQREWERYGGEAGMRLAEAIFFHDSLACLELIDAERRGAFARSRREYSLLFVERFLDLMELGRDERVAFYAFGHSWPLKDGTWNADDLRTLDERFRGLEPGLVDLLRGGSEGDAWGGDEPAAIAGRALGASRPVLAELKVEHGAGRIAQDLIHLAWSYTHMHCNRLGIDAVGEAILRYFMWRLYTGSALPA